MMKYRAYVEEITRQSLGDEVTFNYWTCFTYGALYVGRRRT